MSFCAPPRAKSWRRHCTRKPRPPQCSLASLARVLKVTRPSSSKKILDPPLVHNNPVMHGRRRRCTKPCIKHTHTHKHIHANFQTLEALNRANCGLSSVALKRTGCDVWQLECRASDVTASVQSDHAFCVNNGSSLFPTLISRMLHHAVLKSSPCRKKPLPHAVC